MTFLREMTTTMKKNEEENLLSVAILTARYMKFLFAVYRLLPDRTGIPYREAYKPV